MRVVEPAGPVGLPAVVFAVPVEQLAAATAAHVAWLVAHVAVLAELHPGAYSVVDQQADRALPVVCWPPDLPSLHDYQERYCGPLVPGGQHSDG